jgi:hypothetical protein
MEIVADPAVAKDAELVAPAAAAIQSKDSVFPADHDFRRSGRHRFSGV